MGYTIHIPFSCSTGVQGFNPDSYDEGMEKTPRNKPQLCPKVTWSTVHEWPVLLGCWGRKVGEPCQLADPSGPPKTLWNWYFLWWYPKSQLVSLLNPTWRVPNHGNPPKSIPKILGLWPLLDGLAALRSGLGSQWLLTVPQLRDTATARSSTRSGCGFLEVMLVRAPEANTADGFTHCWWWSLRFSHRPQRFALLSCWGEVLGKVKGCPCANSDILVRYNFQ